jgi:hypothetical protein
MVKKGWFKEPARHSLAAKGIKSMRKVKRAIPLKMKMNTIKKSDEELYQHWIEIHDRPAQYGREDISNLIKNGKFKGTIRGDDIHEVYEVYELDRMICIIHNDASKFSYGIIAEIPTIYINKPTIETVNGTAHYVTTKLENDGRWHDDYYTKDGYYVIHEGKRHHIYKVE